MSCCGSWMAAPSPLKLSPPSPLQRNKNGVSSSFLCCGHRSDQKSGAADLALSTLHDSLEASGIDTKHARAAREGFCEQIGRLTEINGDTSIAISKGPDLARTALFIAAEDDSLVSHSSVPLPVEAFIERLDDLSMGFCPLYMPPSHAPPEVFLANLERYFYVHKGFHRPNVMSDSRALYLHSVLTCRLGSAVMLSLIYSEMLKMLRICGFLDFDVEIYFPHDLLSLPRGYHKQKSKLSDQPHIMTAKSLLVEILRDLKDAFWPFQYNKSNSLFLRAAYAANHVRGPSFASESYSEPCSNVSGLEIASSKAAQHRIGRGVWTSVRFGDMRRALAACERLILLAADYHDLRDYAVLLYHCGHYEECLHYLKLYKSSKSQGLHIKRSQTRMDEDIEEDAVEKMMARVILILGEEGWGKQTVSSSYWGDNSEPW